MPWGIALDIMTANHGKGVGHRRSRQAPRSPVSKLPILMYSNHRLDLLTLSAAFLCRLHAIRMRSAKHPADPSAPKRSLSPAAATQSSAIQKQSPTIQHATQIQ